MPLASWARLLVIGLKLHRGSGAPRTSTWKRKRSEFKVDRKKKWKIRERETAEESKVRIEERTDNQCIIIVASALQKPCLHGELYREST